MADPDQSAASGTPAPDAGAVVDLNRGNAPSARRPAAEIIPPADPAPRPAAYVWLAPLAPRELPRNPFWPPPILGSLALIFGLTALLQAPIVFGPLGALFGLLALLRGQFWFAAVGGLTALAALAASPTFWALIGLSWVIGYWIL